MKLKVLRQAENKLFIYHQFPWFCTTLAIGNIEETILKNVPIKETGPIYKAFSFLYAFGETPVSFLKAR